MTELENTDFNAATFLGKAGLGRRTVRLKPKEAFFFQGDPADSVFYLQKGRARISVISDRGKEARLRFCRRVNSSARSRLPDRLAFA